MDTAYIENSEKAELEVKPYSEVNYAGEYDIDRIIFDLNSKVEMLSSQAVKVNGNIN